MNEERCEKMLAAGAERGIFPAKDAIERLAAELVSA